MLSENITRKVEGGARTDHYQTPSDKSIVILRRLLVIDNIDQCLLYKGLCKYSVRPWSIALFLKLLSLLSVCSRRRSRCSGPVSGWWTWWPLIWPVSRASHASGRCSCSAHTPSSTLSCCSTCSSLWCPTPTRSSQWV